MSSVYRGKRGRGCLLELGSSESRLPTGFQIQASPNPPQNMSPVPVESLRTKRRCRGRPRSVIPNERKIITRSMSMNADSVIVLDGEKNDVVVLDEEKNDVIVVDDKEKKKDVIVLDDEEKKDEEAVAKIESKEEIKGEEKTEATFLGGPGSSDVSGGLVRLEDWPWTWTYEEEWLWWGKGSGVECYPHWEALTGVTGVGNIEDSDDDIWGFDDIWQLRKIKEIPKP